MKAEIRKQPSFRPLRPKLSLRKPWRNWLLPASIAVSPWVRAES